MALADLMKRGFLTSATATATPATPATHISTERQNVAGVAGVAVANIQLLNSAIDDFLKYKKFSQSEFDLIINDQEPIDSFEIITRVNNLAWNFMLVDGFKFSEAIKAASKIVIGCPIEKFESSYAEAMNLINRVSTAESERRFPPI